MFAMGSLEKCENRRGKPSDLTQIQVKFLYQKSESGAGEVLFLFIHERLWRPRRFRDHSDMVGRFSDEIPIFHYRFLLRWILFFVAQDSNKIFNIFSHVRSKEWLLGIVVPQSDSAARTRQLPLVAPRKILSRASVSLKFFPKVYNATIKKNF